MNDYTIHRPFLRFMTIIFIGFSFTLPTAAVAAAESTKSISPPEDPTQSINYWKPHTIDPNTDNKIVIAQNVFAVLLRTWDTARIEPSLYVVDSSAGPWAASLSDGNILMSREAIDVCFQYGEYVAEHLLAFILGHELAHQRADDLWHLKFLRLAGSQAPEIQKKLVRDLKINTESISQLEQREAQADHDGLLIMASVGYDPFKIFEQKDFFTHWVENLWDVSCNNEANRKAVKNACLKAKNRALRTRAQLSKVADQNALFELGVQAYVAANYAKAREYFNAFGKEFPNHSVFTNIGASYLQEAININNRLSELDPSELNFIYPIRLTKSPLTSNESQLAIAGKRGSTDLLINQLKEKRRKLVEQGIKHFEKALRLQPGNRNLYTLIASSYLVDNNTFMTRGILQGKYQPKFGLDIDTKMILAITEFKQNNSKLALKKLDELSNQAFQRTSTKNKKNNAKNNAENINPILYAITHNSAMILNHLNQLDAANRAWTKLARQAKKSGNGYMFQLALNNLKGQPTKTSNQISRIKSNASIGAEHKNSKSLTNEFWLDGDRFILVRNQDGSKLVVDNNSRIISARNVSFDISSKQQLDIGSNADRPLKLLGIPDRRIQLGSSEYLAYDKYSMAIHILNDKVAGWFQY